jgi:regulator of sigma E protease
MERVAPHLALPAGVTETYDTTLLSFSMLGRLVTGREPISNLKGPVGIADTTGRAIGVNMEVEGAPLSVRLWGVFWTIIQLTALISVGIGVVNLLPLPVLDGGHLVFNVWEMVSRRPIPEKVQAASLTFGMVLLFGVAAVVTWHDVVGTGVLRAFGVQ